jgi:hypothetical protein
MRIIKKISGLYIKNFKWKSICIESWKVDTNKVIYMPEKIALMDLNKLDDYWFDQYEADYGQFFTAQISTNKITKIYKEQVQDLIKELETYIKTPLLIKEEMLQLNTFIKTNNLFSISSLFLAHKVILEVFALLKR